MVTVKRCFMGVGGGGLSPEAADTLKKICRTEKQTPEEKRDKLELTRLGRAIIMKVFLGQMCR